MHRIPMEQRGFRSGFWWSAVGAALVAVAVGVWVARPGAAGCEPVPPEDERVVATKTFPFGGSGVAARPTHAGPQVPGEARYYASSQAVACSFGELPPDGLYVGLSGTEYGQADLCGAYLDVRGPRGEVRVLVADRCPGCAPGQVDLSATAFDRIADRAQGVAPVGYNLVRDPEPAPRLSVVVKPDSSPAWFAVLVTGAGNPLRQVALRGSDGHWRELYRGMDNYWTVSGAGAGPFALRITDAFGREVEVEGVSPDSGVVPVDASLYGSPVAVPDTTPPATAAPPVDVDAVRCAP